jgi:serine/threonine protein kinase
MRIEIQHEQKGAQQAPLAGQPRRRDTRKPIGDTMRSAGNPPQSDPVANLGKYRLIADLARGGMGLIHLAVLKGPGGFTKLLVVKELRPELANDPAFVTMFFDEARVAARLSHPNIVQTIEVGSQEGRHYLAMEYVDGPSLQKFARRAHRLGKPVPLSVHLYLLTETLTALEYAHALTERDGSPVSLVHRDVSPHNVLVTYDGHVKLVDFGIAQTGAAAEAAHAGVLKGKMMYMAPEQAACEPVDRRADVFSAGLVLWEAIVGRQPWEGLTDPQILRHLISGEIPRVRDALPEVDANLLAIVDRATSAEPDDRYPTALAMRSDLERYRALLGDDTGPAEVGALLAELFAEDRERLHKIIDERVRLLGERGVPASTPSPLASTSSRPPPPDEPQREVAVPPLPSLAPSAMWIPEPSPPRRRAWVAAALLVAAVGGGVWLARGRALEGLVELWPTVFGGATAAGRAATTASATDMGPQRPRPREEHVPLSSESPVPVHEAVTAPQGAAAAQGATTPQGAAAPQGATAPQASTTAQGATTPQGTSVVHEGAPAQQAAPRHDAAPAASTKGDTFPFGRL